MSVSVPFKSGVSVAVGGNGVWVGNAVGSTVSVGIGIGVMVLVGSGGKVGVNVAVGNAVGDEANVGVGALVEVARRVPVASVACVAVGGTNCVGRLPNVPVGSAPTTAVGLGRGVGATGLVGPLAM